MRLRFDTAYGTMEVDTETGHIKCNLEIGENRGKEYSAEGQYHLLISTVDVLFMIIKDNAHAAARAASISPHYVPRDA